MGKFEMPFSGTISDQDILRVASLVVTNFGDRAWARCAERVCMLLEQGDLEAVRECRRVLAAIEELQSTERPDGIVAH
jgi:hypothetical protein